MHKLKLALEDLSVTESFEPLAAPGGHALFSVYGNTDYGSTCRGISCLAACQIDSDPCP